MGDSDEERRRQQQEEREVEESGVNSSVPIRDGELGV